MKSSKNQPDFKSDQQSSSFQNFYDKYLVQKRLNKEINAQIQACNYQEQNLLIKTKSIQTQEQLAIEQSAQNAYQKVETTKIHLKQDKMLKSHDTPLNKGFQQSLIKDIQDLGSNCGCGEKTEKPKGGLNYKARNKKLIQKFTGNVYANVYDKKEIKNDQINQKQKSEKLDLGLELYQFNEKTKKQHLSQQFIPKTTFDENKFNFLLQKSRIQSQKKLKISSHDVYFPYQAYPSQIMYMQKVLQSLDRKSNAVLQSPTGTGKTLCLLSATMSWIQEKFLKKSGQYSVIYLSRTHSQLAQVQKQLQKTAFRPTIATFGSRQILCIKEQLQQLKGRQKVEACSRGIKLFLKHGLSQTAQSKRPLFFDQPQQNSSKQKVKDLSKMSYQDRTKIESAMCTYYSSQRRVLQIAQKRFKNKLISTQKIRELGKQHSFCPYYYPQYIKPICNLFLMPYNYLLDSDLIHRYKSIIQNSILIFDQGHNVPDAACQGRSFSINKKTFQDAKKQMTRLTSSGGFSQALGQIIWKYQHSLKSFQIEIDRVLARINGFVNQIDYQKNNKYSEENQAFKKMFSEDQTQRRIYQLLYEKCYDHEVTIFKNPAKDSARRDLIIQMTTHMYPIFQNISKLCEQLSQTPDGSFQNVQKVTSFVKKCLNMILQSPDKIDWKQREINHHRVMVAQQKSWQVNIICLVPFLTFQTIQSYKPLNIIITSGTLSPLSSWTDELNIPFPISLNNTHVIPPRQLLLRIIKASGQAIFNFSYKNLNENFKTIYDQTLVTITDLAECTPNGMLVIVPSYKVLNSLQKNLEFKRPLKKRLSDSKQIFIQKKGDFEQLIKNYRKYAVTKKGAILFCVCRGKISEGIDFPNQLCRSVIFIGIPFPNLKDCIIDEKKQHYNRLKQFNPKYQFTGEKWYENNTFRAVGQAIGRVIRHLKDFGTIFLLDSRYNSNYRNQLPAWSMKSYQAISDFNLASKKQIIAFFKQMEAQFGNYEGKQQIRGKQSSFEDQTPIINVKIEQKPYSKYSTNSFTPRNNVEKRYSKQQFAKQQKPAPKNLFQKIMGSKQPTKSNKKKPSFI